MLSRCILKGVKESSDALIPELCSTYQSAVELIGRRWTGSIVFVLLRRPCRFATLRDAIPGITDRMLTERLQELEEEGIIDRTVFPESPVRVEYSLTKKGRALAKVVDAIGEWAHGWAGGKKKGNGTRTQNAERRGKK